MAELDKIQTPEDNFYDEKKLLEVEEEISKYIDDQIGSDRDRFQNKVVPPQINSNNSRINYNSEKSLYNYNK
jgi:hypothetical protein